MSVQGEAVGGSGFSWTWGYDSRGELTGATHSTDTTRNRAYDYDPLGNRLTVLNGTDSGDRVYYCANGLNQYTDLSRYNQGCPPDMPDATLVYDADGNLTNDGGVNHLSGFVGTAYTLVYDGENRLVEARPTTLSVGCTKVAYTYDYRNRRVRRQTFNGDPNATPMRAGTPGARA